MSINFTPTLPKDRIELLDILRGLAIVGVLISNIVIFSGFMYTPFTDLANMHLPDFNYLLNMAVLFIIRGKFYPILMMLFGAGMYMQFQKSKKPGFLKYFIWRMFLLFLIGVAHMLIWPGDVVGSYALFALLLIPIRSFKPHGYLIIAIAMFILHFAVAFIKTNYFTPEITDAIKPTAIFQYPGVRPSELISAVQNNGFAGLHLVTSLQFNLLINVPRYIEIFPKAVMLFVLGAYLYGSGFFTEKAHKLKYVLLFFGIGIMGTALVFVSYDFKIIDNTFLGLAYICLTALLVKKLKPKRALRTLAPLGRMALTNYIMQSVICVIIFYGVGFGYFAKLPYYMVNIIGIAILVFQIYFSKFWLNHFRFGPLEALWRRLSYGKIPKE